MANLFRAWSSGPKTRAWPLITSLNSGNTALAAHAVQDRQARAHNDENGNPAVWRNPITNLGAANAHRVADDTPTKREIDLAIFETLVVLDRQQYINRFGSQPTNRSPTAQQMDPKFFAEVSYVNGDLEVGGGRADPYGNISFAMKQ